MKQCALAGALCIGIIKHKRSLAWFVWLVGKKSNKAAGSSAAFPYIFVKAGMVLFYFLGSKVNQEKENGLVSENNSWVKFKTRITIAFSISHLNSRNLNIAFFKTPLSEVFCSTASWCIII